MSITLNENNIQAPFQYRIGENTFELKTVSGELHLSSDNVQVKVFEGERLFCADIGYAVDGALELMEFLINDIRVYPHLLNELKDLKTVAVKDNEIYLIKDDINFKSIIFFPLTDLNQKFNFRITTYSSTFSSFMFDDIAVKLNKLDENIPIKNYYIDEDYEVNDIIKYNAYLYRVFKKFTSDGTDYHLKANCSLLTPFKKLELNNRYKANDLIEYNNNFFIVQKDFLYQNSNNIITDLTGLLKPLQDIIVWFDGITKIYKNQIIIKDNIPYIVLEDIDNPIWNSIQNKIDRFIKASNIFYDDSNTSFGSNIDNIQKAIEAFDDVKQDKLISGGNIILNRNNISINGGTNKEYTAGNLYFINDLIIYENNLYRVNENFTASNWNTDISKCTLISTGESGGATAAIDVSFDNSKAQLQELIGYDYPKFKVPIPDVIDIVLANLEGTSIGTVEYSASISKADDGSYRLSSEITNINFGGTLIIKSVAGKTNIFEVFSIISQFFNILEPIQTTQNEININDDIGTGERTFQFNYYTDLKVLAINIQTSSMSSEIINITLNIKNRVLRPLDRNLFILFSSQDLLTYKTVLQLANNGTSVSLKGQWTDSEASTYFNEFGFYSDIIENYFNVIDIKDITTPEALYPLMRTTTELFPAVNNLKAKFVIIKNTNTLKDTDVLYNFLIVQEDNTPFPDGITFTFNLTPDKNASLNPIYQNVTNVQQMGEALIVNQNYNNIVMPINKTFEINGEKRKCYERTLTFPYEFLYDGVEHIASIGIGQITSPNTIYKFGAYVEISGIVNGLLRKGYANLNYYYNGDYITIGNRNNNIMFIYYKLSQDIKTSMDFNGVKTNTNIIVISEYCNMG